MSILQRTIDILRELVAIDSVSYHSNVPIIDYIDGYLKSNGIATKRIVSTAGKENIFATLGPKGEAGVILSGHTDVVPVDGQNWNSPPFDLTEQEGCLYGRGTADMKSFIAICLALVPEMIKTSLKRPIHLAFSCDEETTVRGVLPMISYIEKNVTRPFGVIVGEPTGLQIVTAQKGYLELETRVTGAASHSALPHLGINAITSAARLISKIEEIAKRFMMESGSIENFDPPYTTINIGIINGGVAENIVADHCTFRWECRPLPSQDPKECLAEYYAYERDINAELKAKNPLAGVSTTEVNYVPGLLPDSESQIVTLAKIAAKRNNVKTAAFCSEAGHFRGIGIPTILCGPGDMSDAHKGNESIKITQLVIGIDFMTTVISELANNDHYTMND